VAETRLDQDLTPEQRRNLTPRQRKTWQLNRTRRGRAQKAAMEAEGESPRSRTSGAASLERNAGKREGTQRAPVGKDGQRVQRPIDDESSVGFPLPSTKPITSF
jgi:hypothetical protein